MKTKPCGVCKGSGKVPDQKAIGAEMRAYRKGYGIPRTRVAKLMGIPQSTLAEMEAGLNSGPTPKLIRAFKAAVKACAKGASK